MSIDAAATSQVPQSALDELVRRAADVAGFPIAWLSLIEGGREQLRARLGVGFHELASDMSFALQEGLGSMEDIDQAFCIGMEILVADFHGLPLAQGLQVGGKVVRAR